MTYITSIPTGDLSELEKREVFNLIFKAQFEYFYEDWETATDLKDRIQMKFKLDDYKDEPVYQVFERILSALKQ